MVEPTRWCPRCRGEFQPGVTLCPDCGVALVAQLPPEADPVPSGPSRPLDPVGFDLHDWPPSKRDALEWMIAGLEIPFEWEAGGQLIVPERRADEVEGFIDYLDAGDDETDDDSPDEQGDESRLPVSTDAAAPAQPTENVEDGEGAAAAAASDDPATVLDWLQADLERLRRAYLQYRADHDADRAFDLAAADTLDEETRHRLDAVLAGEEDDEHGPGFGLRAVEWLRGDLERRAWTIPAPGA